MAAGYDVGGVLVVGRPPQVHGTAAPVLLLVLQVVLDTDGNVDRASVTVET